MSNSNKQDIIHYCETALIVLKHSSPVIYAQNWIQLREIFHREFCNELIFSTRFGSDFFSEVKNKVVNNSPIEPDIDKNGEKLPLGEFDINFNNWLKNLK